MLGVLFVMVVGGVIVAATYGTEQARKRAIEAAFRVFGAEPARVRATMVPGDLGLRWAIEGRVRGVTVRYALRAGGKGAPNLTICETDLAAPTSLEMDLRPETAREVRNVEHGRAIDLVLGDEAFDDSFIVEAAPSEMARALLDRNSRTGLLAFHPCTMAVTGSRLRFAKTGYLAEPAEIGRVLELCVGVAARLPSLPAQLLEQRLADSRVDEASGYRGASAEAIRALDRSPRDASELVALHEARAKRTRFRVVQGLTLVTFVILAGIVLGILKRR